MSVVINTLSEINDSIVFTMDYPVSDILSMNTFNESIENESATRLFKREFRYAIDSINFSDWISLTNANLSNIDILPTDLFQAEFRYTRVGTDESGLLVFNWVRLNYTTDSECASFPYYDQSIFKYFYDCFDHRNVKEWCTNVLRKLYFPGIIPIYIVRNVAHNANREDQDYISFWNTISCFFSIIVNHAKAFEGFNNNSRLITRYLQNRDLIISRNQSLEELQFLMENIHNQSLHRGTGNIINKKDVASGINVDGELLRLVEYDDRCDELLFNIANFGWLLDQRSPMYKTIDNSQTIKGYEKGDTIDLNNYPLINSDKVSIIDESGEDVILITDVDDTTKAGIGFTDSAILTDADKELLLNIDPELTYELSFMVRGDAPFSVGVYGYNSAISPTNPDTINPLNNTNFAIVKQKVAIDSEWFLVKVILFNTSQVSSLNPEVRLTSLGLGNNLKLPATICKAAFEITLDRSNTINQPPAVGDSTISIPATTTRVITVLDINNSYQDIEGDPYKGIIITELKDFNSGELLFNNTVITNTDLPLEIDIIDIAAGKLVFRETGSVDADYIAAIVFNPIDNQPVEASNDNELYLKNIRFKLLNRSYETVSVNGTRLVETWIRNRSGESNDAVDSIIRNTLIPYNTLNFNNHLE